MMVNRLAKVDIKRFTKAVHEYVEAQQAKKTNDEIFEKAKNKFADAADIYFKLKGNDELLYLRYRKQVFSGILISLQKL